MRAKHLTLKRFERTEACILLCRHVNQKIFPILSGNPTRCPSTSTPDSAGRRVSIFR
ncbi:hypothetical protein X961_5615 [Burkholderia pseudomallei MSHR5613]|nr:hypothetical protein X961_5615 [Burkholderia pseudomallei MSHR5613]